MGQSPKGRLYTDCCLQVQGSFLKEIHFLFLSGERWRYDLSCGMVNVGKIVVMSVTQGNMWSVCERERSQKNLGVGVKTPKKFG